MPKGQIGASIILNRCKYDLIQGVAEITPTFGGVTARAVEGVQ